MTSIRPYLTVFRMRFVLMLQYRAAAIAGFGTQCWWGFIKVMVFAAFFRSSSALSGVSMPAETSVVLAIRFSGNSISPSSRMTCFKHNPVMLRDYERT